MPTAIRDVMTSNPATVQRSAPVTEAARMMRDMDVGDVLVTDEQGSVRGIVTDRDIAVRAVAEGRDLRTSVGDICSGDLVCVGPGDSVEKAIDLMRDRAVRRLPVVDGQRAVGIVSIGDLAVERDPSSTLADISAAPPNA